LTRGLVAVCCATLVSAGALVWIGLALLGLPNHQSAFADSLAGGNDGRRFAVALRLFADSMHETARTDAAFVRRARAEAALAAARGDPHVRARAETLLGVLALRDAAAQPQRTKAFTGAALNAFQVALRLDPDNEEAATDLELLLLSQSTAKRKAASREADRRKGGAHKVRPKGHGHRRGAGSTPPGAGGF